MIPADGADGQQAAHREVLRWRVGVLSRAVAVAVAV